VPYASRFPELRVEDIARASQAAVDSLGIDRLHAIVGASLGGMTALAHAVVFPGKARRMISISGALAASAGAIATRSLQREILGAALKSGADAATVAQAMRWARKIGVLSYVGRELLEERFGREQTEPFAGRPSGTAFEVEHWLEHLAQKFLKQFNPWAYWYISRAMDLFDFGAHAGSPGGDAIVHHHDASDVARAAAHLRLERALVIGVHEDLLFPLAQQREVAVVLRNAQIDTEFVELRSPYGHDAFLTEAALFTPVLGAFLQRDRGSATSHPSHRAHDSLCR
jgi:homoserine O-acetyltransferase